MMFLYLRFQLSESIFIHLREGKATIACKATATHAFGQINMVGAEFG
jgi:hypothetical protein